MRLTAFSSHSRQLSLTPDFPANNILVRNPAGEPARSLYLTNDIVHAVVQNNDFKKMRLMNAGTKIFTKQEGGFGKGKQPTSDPTTGKPDTAASTETPVTPFRLLSEGLPVVLPYIKKESIVDADLGALRTLVEEYYPLLDRFGESFKSAILAKRKFLLIEVIQALLMPLSSTGQSCRPVREGDGRRRRKVSAAVTSPCSGLTADDSTHVKSGARAISAGMEIGGVSLVDDRQEGEEVSALPFATTSPNGQFFLRCSAP